MSHLDSAGNGLGGAPTVFGAEEILQSEPPHPSLRMAQEPIARRVHRHEAAIHPRGDDAVVDALDDGREKSLAAPDFLLGQAQRLLHLLERGDELLRLVLGDGEVVLDDHAGGRRAQGGGEQPLEADAQLEELGHGELGGRLAAEELAHERLGFLCADVVVHESLDLRGGQDGRRHRRVLVLSRRPHERGGLGAVVGVLLAQERHEDEEPDVDEERPEHAMRRHVEPGEAEERGGVEPLEPERPVGEDGRGHESFLDEGGDDQRIEPQRESRRDPGRRALSVAAPPVESEQDGRGALADRDEGQQRGRECPQESIFDLRSLDHKLGFCHGAFRNQFCSLLHVEKI